MGGLALGTLLIIQAHGATFGGTSAHRSRFQLESSNLPRLPQTSLDHLARRGYTVEVSVQTLHVVAATIEKLPAEERAALPSVVVVGSPDDRRLQKSDPQVQAFVIPGDADHVYVTRWGGAFRAAANGHEIELAGALAHEVWHLQQGPDEVGAYDHQLSVLQEMHAPLPLIDQIRRAKENAVYTQEFERRKRRPKSEC